MTPLGRVARRRPQLVVLGLAVTAMFASGPGQSFVLAVFVDEILAAADLSRSAFSVLYAAATVVSALVVSRLGLAADRLGMRAIWVVVAVGLAAACGVASLVTGALTALVALSLLRAFGQGAFPLVATLLVARAFRGRRGQAMAVASLGITAAAVVLPPIGVLLVVEIGWRAAFRVFAVALLVLVVPLVLLLREPRRDETRPGGAAAGRRGPRALRRSRRLPRLTVPSNRARRLLLVLTAPPLVITAVVFHATALLAERGLPLAAAGAALSLMGLATLGGTIAAGAVADRISSRTLLALMCGLLAASPLVLVVPARPTAYLAFVLLGAGGGFFGVAMGIVWPRTYGLAEIGRLQGTSFSVQIAAAAAGPLPLALSEGAFGRFSPALVALAAYGAIALVVALRWREPRIVRGASRP